MVMIIDDDIQYLITHSTNDVFSASFNIIDG